MSRELKSEYAANAVLAGEQPNVITGMMRLRNMTMDQTPSWARPAPVRARSVGAKRLSILSIFGKIEDLKRENLKMQKMLQPSRCQRPKLTMLQKIVKYFT